MFRIRPALAVLSFLVLVCTLMSCASDPAEQASANASANAGGEAPEWVHSLIRYPQALYLTGKGTGKSRADAERSALAVIAQAFDTEVLFSTGGQEFFSTKGGKTEETRETSTETKIRTYTQLFNIQYDESWLNPQTREWEALAYINREDAWKTYEPRLKQSIAVFTNLLKAAEAEQDKAKKYYLLSRAQAVSGETIQMLNYAGVLAPEQAGKYQSTRGDIAALPTTLSKMAVELGIDESKLDNRIEALNYYYSAVTYTPDSVEARNLLNKELELPVGGQIKALIERYGQWKKNLEEFTRFYTAHPPFALYYTQFGTPVVYYSDNPTFDLDFYVSLRRPDDLKVMQGVFANLNTQLAETGMKDEWGREDQTFSNWPGNASVFSTAGRTFRFVADLVNERNEVLAQERFEMTGWLVLSADQKIILTDSTQDVRIVFSRVQYNEATITNNLQVRISSVDGRDITAAGLEGYLNIIPAAQLPLAQPRTAPAVKPGKEEPTVISGTTAIGSNKAAAGFLNLAFGLGSFLQKDWAGGFTLLGGYALAGGLIAWELSLDYNSPLAAVPGNIGLGVAGATVIYGFIRPFIYDKNKKAAQAMDRIHIAALPDTRGRTGLRLAYTLQTGGK